jgi:hypothetical protein
MSLIQRKLAKSVHSFSIAVASGLLRYILLLMTFLKIDLLFMFLQTYPTQLEGKSALPEGSFITASGDDTIRVWNLDPHMDASTPYRRNIYSNVRAAQAFFTCSLYIMYPLYLAGAAEGYLCRS